MLAHKYNGQDPIGYYISEKLDGYRAILSEKGFMSRNNKPFNAPDKYIKDIMNALPKGTVLDGELYTKRNDFAGMGVVRKKIPVDSEWKKITYMVFDLPLVKAPFQERYNLMKQLLKNVPHVKIVECTKITSIEQFNNIHKTLVSNGAEGTILREPNSYYEHGRSHNLLKVKDSFDDEVKIIGYELGTGRNEGRLGALHVKWLDPKIGTNAFKVGSGFDDKQRDNYKKLYPLNSIITIKYWEIDKASKKARFPIFLRIRHKE
jgi:DNA ligase-1